MPIELNAQYGKFVQFANQQMRAGNDEAIARDGGAAAGNAGGRAISAAAGDKVAAFMRSESDKAANNAVRDLFRMSVVALFGGEAFVPESVKDAMRLEDYGKGKPLTARRIIAVKTEVDRILAEHRDFNAGVRQALSDGRTASLPQDMRDALAGLAGDLRAVFGEGIVPQGADIMQLINSAHFAAEIDAVIQNADGQGRDVTAAEVAGAISGKAFDRLSAKAIGMTILDKIRDRGLKVDFTENSIGAQFCIRHPDFAAEMRLCKNTGDVAGLYLRYEAKIDAFVDLTARSRAAAEGLAAKASAKLAAALGLDARLVAALVPAADIGDAVTGLTTGILSGSKPGSQEEGYDVEAAFDAIADKFVQKRVDVCAGIDSLDIPEGAKSRWKAEYMTIRSIPKITPAQLFEIMQSFDMRKLEGALSKGLPAKIAVEMFKSLAGTFLAEITRVTGDPSIAADAGVDDLMPLYGMILAVAEAKNPNLAAMIEGVRSGLAGEIASACEKDGSVAATILVKTIQVKGGTEKRVAVADRIKFDALAAEHVESALAEAGIDSEKIRNDVKDALQGRVNAALAGAGGLKDLSDFLPTLRAEAANLGKALDAIMKCRAGAKETAAARIAEESGMNKAYVLNNLNMDRISSASGKIRFIYDDVLAKARNGEAYDGEGALDKANEAVSKFAQAKIAILSEIDKVGFGAEERAEHRRTALCDAAWTDPDVVKAAKRLAENATLKNAARLLAAALRPEQVAMLDDPQVCDVFMVFGRAFSTVFVNEFGEYADKWAETPEDRQKMQAMMIQLMQKAHPDIAESLARLAASGRMGSIANIFSAELNTLHSLKLDYMTLLQFNLKGDPAGEPVRATMTNPALKYDEAEMARIKDRDHLCNVANGLLTGFAGDFASTAAFDADKYIAARTKGREIVEKYAADVAEEAVPLLGRLVRTLDWRAPAAAASEALVARYVEDMKHWRDVVPGSPEADGLERVLHRRTEGYMKDTLANPEKFNSTVDPGLFPTFTQDLPRCDYVINGKIVTGKGFAGKIPAFNAAIKDPAKRKAVSLMVNQQLFGDYTASVANMLPLEGWKPGMESEPVDSIPGVRNFTSRNIADTGYQLFDTGPATFAIDVAPGETAVKVRATVEYPIHADVSMPDAKIGTATVTQEFVIDFTGAEPAIRDFKIGQALA